MAETRIAEDEGIVTQINVLTVRPENQRALFEEMRKQSTEVMERQPGFVAINLHRALDGTRVTNYAQWEGEELLDAAHDTDAFKQTLWRYRHYVLDAGPRVYDVTHMDRADGRGNTTIREGDDGVTLINVSTTTTEDQERVADLLASENDIAREVPGFRTGNVLRSHDGTRVVNYAQWDDQEAWEAARRDNPAYREHMARISQPDPHLYEVAFAIHS